MAQGLPRSPLAPVDTPSLPPISGVRLATASAGIFYDRADVLMVDLPADTAVAGVFTKSKTASAPVHWCRDILRKGTARGLVVNAGNANAFTGYEGVRAVAATTAAVAKALGCRADEVFASSTGVIGEKLPTGKVLSVVDTLKNGLSETNWLAAAEAIRTTDTFPKVATRSFSIGAAAFHLNGIAKGSGMIAPDMGTMLAYVFTDAAIPSDVLQSELASANEQSFNAITVDSDTSTSDTVLAFATGAGPAHAAIADRKDPQIRGFRRALRDLLRDLAHQIVRDGEGASKFVRIDVSGAKSKRAARRIGLAVANSPLVKTAIAGEDPNWGRIVMAVGKAGEAADRDRLRISFGEHVVAENGVRAAGYDEATVAAYMKNPEISIAVDVGVGRSRFTVWTCDFTEAYIRINADYRS
ncbi:MAG: bifunctional glutamate N-acetyltransferase/amino-acid acetyltransferase ArgJ [Alphaproteobacteria bacterium]